ncbi:OprO/OprP family phosphate-selective porin [Sulfuriflexus mobilis]|uniref:OprO/OprP family phosphate-selective porin n=1 Tax=Sulfuriflexus mobilis TaxID=1811807 RepID=UPI000F832B49|nr:OprO/OprP family phosphate-selective porin [Sulfuriflexus mobilis]
MKMNQKLSTLAAATMLATMSLPAEAGDKELLEVLLENGVISKQQHQELKKQYGKNSGTQISTKGGIKAKSEDGDFSFQFGGRVMVDAGYVDEDVSKHDSGTEFRRLRMFAKGTLYRDWGYKVQVDYSDDALAIKDAYLKYKPWGVTIGNFKQPISLEELTSSKYITFMERSLPTVFATSHRIGVGINKGGNNWSAAASIYGGNSEDNEDGQEGYGLGARVTFAPIAEKTRAIHLGAAVAHEEPLDDADVVRFRQRPEFHATGTRIIDTGSISNVEDIEKFGLEAAAVFGPFSLQGEYLKVDVSRESGFDDADFDGAYLTASYFLTGESRPYSAKKGKFGRVKPKAKSGAWELAVRYSTLDLDDGAIQGGEEDNLTLGLNWYVNPNVRIMANYIDVDAEVAGVDDDPNIFAMRAQIDF